jgi:PAS domain-containing protein
LEGLYRRVALLEEEKRRYEDAKEHRKKLREKYCSLLDSMTAVLWLVDRHGKVVRVNEM